MGLIAFVLIISGYWLCDNIVLQQLCTIKKINLLSFLTFLTEPQPPNELVIRRNFFVIILILASTGAVQWYFGE